MLDHIRQNRENILNTFINKDELIKGGPGSGRHPLDDKIAKFTAKYPNDTKSWGNATAELADLHQSLADYHNDNVSPKEEYKLREGHSQSPSDHNTYHKEGINKLLGKLKPHQKDSIERDYANWFKKSESVSMDKDEFIDEHKKLVSVLESPSHEDDKDEAAEQKKELKDEMQKGGEGSRGGKVIGHTSSGKPVYDVHFGGNGIGMKHSNGGSTKSNYSHFSIQDHKDAAAMFKRAGEEKEDQMREDYGKVIGKKLSKLGNTGENLAYIYDKREIDIPHMVDHSMNAGLKDHQHLSGLNNMQWHHESQAEKKEKLLKKTGSFDKGESDEFGSHIANHQDLLKSQIAGIYAEDELEKGGKRAVIGEKRTFGGKEYIKVSAGWRLVGKNSGKHKDISEALHGKNAVKFTSEKEEEAAYQKIRDKVAKDFDSDDEEGDEDEIGREADRVFKEKYGVEPFETDYDKHTFRDVLAEKQFSKEDVNQARLHASAKVAAKK